MPMRLDVKALMIRAAIIRPQIATITMPMSFASCSPPSALASQVSTAFSNVSASASLIWAGPECRCIGPVLFDRLFVRPLLLPGIDHSTIPFEQTVPILGRFQQCFSRSIGRGIVGRVHRDLCVDRCCRLGLHKASPDFSDLAEFIPRQRCEPKTQLVERKRGVRGECHKLSRFGIGSIRILRGFLGLFLFLRMCHLMWRTPEQADRDQKYKQTDKFHLHFRSLSIA